MNASRMLTTIAFVVAGMVGASQAHAQTTHRKIINLAACRATPPDDTTVYISNNYVALGDSTLVCDLALPDDATTIDAVYLETMASTGDALQVTLYDSWDVVNIGSGTDYYYNANLGTCTTSGSGHAFCSFSASANNLQNHVIGINQYGNYSAFISVDVPAGYSSSYATRVFVDYEAP